MFVSGCSNNSAFVKSVEVGDMQNFYKLLGNDKVLANTKNKVGDSALILALKNNNIEAAKRVITVGADVNVRDSEGMTPLMYASRIGNSELVKQLVTKNADLTAKSNNGYTVLMYAKLSNNTGIIRFIREKVLYIRIHQGNNELFKRGGNISFMKNFSSYVRLASIDQGTYNYKYYESAYGEQNVPYTEKKHICDIAISDINNSIWTISVRAAYQDIPELSYIYAMNSSEIVNTQTNESWTWGSPENNIDMVACAAGADFDFIYHDRFFNK
jgi:FOG: Ankyrin repeat